MKTKLNKATLSQMPEQIRSIVSEWKARYHKSTISVENVEGFYADEDARVTLINLFDGAQKTARVAGDFAGYTNLSPTAKIPLQPGVVAIEQGFFCGHPYLNIYQGSAKQIAA